jgi:hypothetical protein
MKKFVAGLIASISLMTAFGVSASTVEPEAFVPFTLAGFSKGEPCMLYVDALSGGADWTRRFAQVRTSFEPSQQIYVTTNPYRPHELISVDMNGRPTRQLTIVLPTRADIRLLHRARAYQALVGEKSWSFQVCKGLHPVRIKN